MPQPVELATRVPRQTRNAEEHAATELGFNYVCRRCDVWGRIPAGVGRRCWSCESTDRLERR